MNLTPAQRATLRDFSNLTRGSCDPWDLMGYTYTAARQRILVAFSDGPVRSKQSGVIRLREVLWKAFDVKDDTLAGKQQALHDKIKEAIQ